MKVSQKKANYTYEIGDSNWVGQTHDMAKDFSALNRQNLTQTNKKGVPYVYTLAITTFPALIKESASTDYLFSGSGQPESMVTNVFYGSPNTWVQRNGAVKTHAAREEMFRDAEVERGERGAYDHTIRYKLETGTPGSTPLKETLTSTVNGTPYDADEIDGGTWDYTQLIFPDDTTGAYLHLCGPHASEETNLTFTSLCMPQLYLSSRAKVLADSNLEIDDTPDKGSVLNKLLSRNYKGTQDEVTFLAREEQDKPPYDLSDLTNDQFYLQELGRSQFTAGQGNSATTVIEAPFGLFEMQSIISEVDLGVGNSGFIDYSVDLLGITEM